MNSDLTVYNQWYETLVEELTDLIIETEFTSRWTLIEGYHAVGSRILKENDNFEREKIYSKNILQRLAKSIGKSERTLYYKSNVGYIRYLQDQVKKIAGG